MLPLTRLDFFRALNPEENYPKSPLGLLTHRIKYDLLLPAFVADALAKELSPLGTFDRFDEFCTPMGVNAVRLTPSAFDPAQNRSAYAESRSHLDLSRDGQTMGCVMEQAACNTMAAADIFRFAMEGERFETKVADWILNRSPFFLSCRGFETNRITYYSDLDEKDAVDASVCGVSVSQEPKPIAEISARRHRFRDMANI
jgi:hypothetical protein